MSLTRSIHTEKEESTFIISKLLRSMSRFVADVVRNLSNGSHMTH